MRITVFGATGNVGTRVVTEALRRGHDITAATRAPGRPASLPPGTRHRTGDAGDIADVIELSTGQDLIISATRPPAGSETDLVKTTRTLLAGVSRTGVRLILVGGAASLTVPGTSTPAIDSPYVSPSYRDIAAACADQLAACRADPSADWTYLSPAALLEPGERTGRYRLGTDELLVDATGVSRVSMEDLAVALLDEAERPRHRRTRFTVADQHAAA
ncbi:NAD(P)-dependent oxidoreductase [Actinomadura macra]|uniref:NAD(P)-dependent oxidoreductase n=1 Tax=Actinomadura macra TaxID=46164 RepID=UPI000836C020|nr:NAD(P)H-binding protein [Actinomadura macra]